MPLNRKTSGRAVLGSKGTNASSVFSSIDEAIRAIRDGQMIIVVDDEDRENEG